MKPCPRRAGFSLIELLVVVGLIALLAGGLGLALNDTGGNALATSQTTLATMLGQARAQAAVQQTETALAIYATRPPAGETDKYLRLLQVFRNATPGVSPPRWEPVGSPVTLPRGVCVVPPSVAGMLATGVVWQSRPPRTSHLRGPVGLGQPAGTLFGTGIAAYLVDFRPDGTCVQADGLPHSRLAVATTTLANNQPQFNNANAVRGLLLRPTGAVTFVNDGTGF